MKAFTITLFFIAISVSLLAQSPNCANFRNGKFKSTYNGHTAMIERSGSNQTEYLVNTKDSLKILFTVKWLDDCSYTLTPTKESFGKYPKLPKNALITVNMTNVTATSYTQTSISTFTDKTIVSEVVKIQ